MKVCIYGAGAIGGWMGVKLAQAGCDVSVVARGATLDALHEHGLRLVESGEMHTVAVKASDDPAALGAQDLVIVAVKAPGMANVAQHIGPLLGANTIVLTAMNGVPWWFCAGLHGEFAGARLASVDPDGSIAAAIPAERTLGCVVHASCRVDAPGVIAHHQGRGLIVGEATGQASERVASLVELLRKAGFDATASAQIQRDVWYKLWGNMTMNPVSAITGATGDRILGDPDVRAFCSAVMREAAAIGENIGCRIEQSAEDRHALTAELGAFKTSMLQDVEAGRAIELDALVGAVHEIGQRLKLPTTNIDILFGLTRLFGRVHGLYPD